jgi:hypothetical protein
MSKTAIVTVVFDNKVSERWLGVRRLKKIESELRAGFELAARAAPEFAEKVEHTLTFDVEYEQENGIVNTSFCFGQCDTRGVFPCRLTGPTLHAWDYGNSRIFLADALVILLSSYAMTLHSLVPMLNVSNRG